MNYLRNGQLILADDRIKEELLVETKVLLKTNFMSWLPPDATLSLLFRASADGKKPADFHRCCDTPGFRGIK